MGLRLHTPIYHALFLHLPAVPIRPLKIGTGGCDKQGGASLAMWADLLCPGGGSSGFDIEEFDLGPCRFSRGARADFAFFAQLGQEQGALDIVIDTASVGSADGARRALCGRDAQTSFDGR